MLEQVENKIQDLQRQQKDMYYKKKEEDLFSWGLTGKNKKNSMPVVVTDDEYEALIEASNGLSNGRNKVASVLNACAIAIVTLGIIIGGSIYSFADSLGIVYFTVSVVVSVLLALLFRGVSEAIRLLQQILDMKRTEDFKKIKHDIPKAYPDTQPIPPQQFSNAPNMHFAYSPDKN